MEGNDLMMCVFEDNRFSDLDCQDLDDNLFDEVCAPLGLEDDFSCCSCMESCSADVSYCDGMMF